MNQNQQAIELTEEIKKVAPAYYVQWVSGRKIFPDSANDGYFEVFGGDKKVHYRRHTADGVRALIY